MIPQHQKQPVQQLTVEPNKTHKDIHKTTYGIDSAARMNLEC